MISFFAKRFIKNYEDTQSPAVRQAYGKLCGIAGIILNLFLFAGKFLAGLIGNSIAITADAFNNLSDAGSSVITLIGFQLSGKDPDPNHPFGHGRLEYFSGLGVSAIILLMAFELLKTSFDKILHPSELTFDPLVLCILIASIAVKFYMYLYNKDFGTRISSGAMQATASDCISDCAATAVVLIATLVQHFAGISIDGWCGLAVGLMIGRAGISAAMETINPLLGQPPEAEFVERIETIVLSDPQVLGIHDLVVHNYGPGRTMISLHAEVSASGDILALHDMIDNVERTLQKELKCDAVIHMDPIVCDDDQTQALREQITAIVHRMSPQATLHDFRMVKGPTHTNVIFDVCVPFGFHLRDDQIISHLGEQIHKLDPSYFSVITVDKSYI
ncbi:MAG: cation transporter [Lachnospiraceae bacterium]|nr:cation transporter [Lachnospiraceae bacterium]